MDRFVSTGFEDAAATAETPDSECNFR